ncbi:hypothetical protein V3C99_003404 [Haemonchus contortus]
MAMDRLQVDELLPVPYSCALQWFLKRRPLRFTILYRDQHELVRESEGIYSDWAFLLNPFSGWMKTAILYALTVLILYRMLQWTHLYFACTFVTTMSMNTVTYLVPAAMNSLHALFVAVDDIPDVHLVVVQDPEVTTELMLIVSIREAVQEAVIDLVNDVLIRGTVLGATIAVIDAAIPIPELAPEVMTVITGNITPQELPWRNIIEAI